MRYQVNQNGSIESMSTSALLKDDSPSRQRSHAHDFAECELICLTALETMEHCCCLLVIGRFDYAPVGRVVRETGQQVHLREG